MIPCYKTKEYATKCEEDDCSDAKNWNGVELDTFMDCPFNLANNRQVRMLANLSMADGTCAYDKIFPKYRVSEIFGDE